MKVRIEVPEELWMEAREHPDKDEDFLWKALSKGVGIIEREPRDYVTNGDIIKALFPFNAFEGSPHAGCALVQYLHNKNGSQSINGYDPKWWKEPYDGGRATQLPWQKEVEDEGNK